VPEWRVSAFCLLLSTFCFLPSAFCLLLTADCLLQLRGVRDGARLYAPALANAAFLLLTGGRKCGSLLTLTYAGRTTTPLARGSKSAARLWKMDAKGKKDTK
jgi:hypothetical protein